MFKKARIKLTAQYLAIIMVISVFFSVIIYEGATYELTRIEKAQRLRRPAPGVPAIDPEVIEDSKRRIFYSLFVINSVIFVLSAGSGYFLAGKTLNPIAKMLEDQKNFVENASHELKTPLAALKSEIEVTLRDKRLSLSQAKKLLKSNLEEVDKMTSLSRYLLNLNRHKNGDVLNFKKVNLKNIAQKSIEKLKVLAKHKNISLVANLKNKYVSGDEQSLIEATVIILENAIKYSPEKSVIKVIVDKKGLSVMDKGIGISKKDMDHIFDKFYRADISRSKDKVDGFGLGLSIAKNIVIQHKGNIKVKSKLGSGSTFTISI